MTSIISDPTKAERINALLSKGTPSYRKAYSDRTAWLMAYLSDLAYLEFNLPSVSDKHEKSFSDTLDRKEKKRELFEKELKAIGFELVEPYDRKGTQAMLVSNGEFIVLAFRGTEEIADIKTNIRAKKTGREKGGKIHTGFKEAYEEVAEDIQDKINDSEFRDKPLFITGHSLGGALATVAAKKLTHKGGIAACYTFGSPRVGDAEWVAGMRAPVYRIVNAIDIVTMLPLSNTFIDTLHLVTKFLGGIMQHLGFLGRKVGSRLSKYGGYMHCGDMRYLTDCPPGQYKDVMLLYSVRLSYRIKGLKKRLPWRKLVADHSRKIYRKKLMIIAERRNKTE